jgi:hypothetical protein
MTKMAEPAGVAHNIAHHSASGLSFLPPHLAQALRAAREETTVIELLEENPYPPNVGEMQPLRLALASLKATVQNILQKHGFNQMMFSRLCYMPLPHLGMNEAMRYIPEL